ncbi:MAG TPA: hypothetical protein IAB15_05520 [Candidatus Ornithoclostridium faecigallinarum]|nr:hypothetical protein [Candidatus Ornithoclostridium faecigallinarum]
MTLKQIVDETKFWLGKERCSIGASGDEATEKLVECARRTLEKIALEYAPLVDVATVVASGGKFTVSALPKRAIAIKKVSKDGETIAFRCLGDVCEVAENGALDVEYHHFPRRAEWEDECEVAPSVSAKSVALGVAAEYCAIEGMPDLAEDFGKRFFEDMRAATRVRREVRLPGRLWL